MKKMIQEFKAFAMRGNVVDMAVGVVIGGAFGKIVSSMVNDMIMPVVGYITGGVDFSNLVITLREKTEAAEAVTVNYGIFINSIIDFLIIAFAIFMVIKQLNRFKKAEVPAAPTTRPCPYCCTDISLKATRCPSCTSQLDG